MQDEYSRKSQLTDSQAVSEATVARLRLRLEAQEAAVEAALAREDMLDAKLRSAEADLAAARQHLDLLIEEQRALAAAEAAVADADAAVTLAEVVRDEADLRFSRMEVRSPAAGIVMKRLASPGSKLMLEGDEHSMHVVHLYDPAHLQVRVDVPLADAAHIAIGQNAEITVEALPDQVFKGRVTRMVHEADLQKNTVEVKVAVENPVSVLKPEMLARVRFLADQNVQPSGAVRQRVFAPQELIVRDGEGGDSVLVISERSDDRGRAERRSLSLGGTRVDGWVEVTSGLQPGDLLILDRPDLEPGDRVRVIGEGDA